MYTKLVVKKKNRIYALPLEDILYMEKNLRKICIHTQIERLELLEVYSRFNDIMYFLDDRFMFCHRSYVINMDKIILMSDQEIFMEGNESIYLGRDAFIRSKKVFDKYLEEKKEGKKGL